MKNNSQDEGRKKSSPRLDSFQAWRDEKKPWFCLMSMDAERENTEVNMKDFFKTKIQP